jgi:membrane protease YdiL (CAAX protease family)
MNTNSSSNKGGLLVSFSNSYPVSTFLLITFIWSWLFWIAAIPFSDDNPVLMMAITFIGGYGPALGSVLTLQLQSEIKIDLSRKRLQLIGIIFLILLGIMSLRIWAGEIPHYDTLSEDPLISVPVIVLGFFAFLTGAFVISSARSSNQHVRATMQSLISSNISWFWLIFVLFFLASLYLISWGLAALIGLNISPAPLSEYSPLQATYLFIITFIVTALIRGGMEEPRWRGFMLPELQKKYSPLVASVIIAFFWDAWHIPLHLNGFYSSGLVEGKVGRSIVIIPASILLTWVYNKSQGQLLVLVILHTTINIVGTAIPSSIVYPVLSISFILFIVFKDKMYLKQR